MRHSLQRVLILTIAVIASAIPLASFAYDVRYWVWQRDNPLEPTGVGGVRGAENRYDLLAGRRIGEHQRDLALESAIQFPIVQHRSHPFRAGGAAGFERATTVFRWIDHGAAGQFVFGEREP